MSVNGNLSKYLLDEVKIYCFFLNSKPPLHSANLVSSATALTLPALGRGGAPSSLPAPNCSARVLRAEHGWSPLQPVLYIQYRLTSPGGGGATGCLCVSLTHRVRIQYS